uniref:HMG box domain-containing protein n=1 Tax=Anopheles farauti TaxID=69004 RepID=A0A182QYD5_9DIPT
MFSLKYFFERKYSIMQFNAMARLLHNSRLLISTRQTGAPFGNLQSSGLHSTASLNDDGTSNAMPEKPKRPVNAYIRFAQSIRSALATSNPKASPTEISKLAAVKWQTLDQASKAKLEDEYKREQAIWLQKNAKYLSQLTDAQKQELKTERQNRIEEKVKRDQKRLLKELGRPKRPLNSFFLFCAQHKPVQGLTKDENKEQMKKLGLQWKQLSGSEKERYVKEAETEMKRYQEEMKKWEDKMLASEHTEVVRKRNVLLPPTPASSRARKGQQSAVKNVTATASVKPNKPTSTTARP